MNKRTVGTRYEELAAKYLTDRGLTILETNFRSRIGEIDLIAKEHGETDHPDICVFVEVKYRRSASSGMPYEALTYKKRKTRPQKTAGPIWT